MARYSLGNGASINVYRSSSGGWNYNLLLHGEVIGGGVGFANEFEAYEAAMDVA